MQQSNQAAYHCAAICLRHSLAPLFPAALLLGGDTGKIAGQKKGGALSGSSRGNIKEI